MHVKQKRWSQHLISPRSSAGLEHVSAEQARVSTTRGYGSDRAHGRRIRALKTDAAARFRVRAVRAAFEHAGFLLTKATHFVLHFARAPGARAQPPSLRTRPCVPRSAATAAHRAVPASSELRTAYRYY